MKCYISGEILRRTEMLNSILRDTNLLQKVEAVSLELAKAFTRGNKLLVAGNGGSAADAQHIVAELVCKLHAVRPALPAVALTVNTSVLTAASNDFGFDSVFERQIQALGKEGDVFLGISTSGKSQNVLNAVIAAKTRRMVTVGFTGSGGCRLADLCDYTIRVPDASTQRIQEAHIILSHIICGLVEREVFECSQ